MEKLIMKIQKKAEKTTNKVRIPQSFINEFGNDFYMEIYKDKIILIPIKKGE